MSKTLPVVDTTNSSSDSMLSVLTKLNAAIALIGAEVVTANSAGATTSGNGFVVGWLGANVGTFSTVQGGNTTAGANVVVASNLVVSGAAMNVAANVTLSGASLTASGNVALVGNLYVSTNALFTALSVSTNSTGGKLVAVNADSVVVTGPATLASAAALSNTLSVAGNATFSNLVSVAGAANLASTLGVAGNAALAASLTVAGSAAVSGNLSVTRAVALSNALSVAGNAALSGALSVSSNLSVTAGAAFANQVSVVGLAALGQVTAVGNLQVLTPNGTNLALAVTANSTYVNAWYAATQHTFTGPVSTGNLTVTGQSSFTGNVQVSAAANVSGNVVLGSALSVSGPAALSNTLVVAGASTLQANLLVSASANVAGSLRVGGAVQVDGSLNVNGNIGTTGNLTYSGVSTANIIPAGVGEYLGNTTFRWYLNASDVDVSNSLAVGSAVTVGAGAAVGANLAVGGCASVSGNVSVTGSVAAGGNASATFLSVSSGVSHGGGEVLVRSSNATTTGTTQQVVDTFAAASYRAARYEVSVTDNAANAYGLTSLALLHDGTTVYLTEWGSLYSNGSTGAFDAAIAGGGSLQLKFTPVSANATVRMVRTLLAV